MLFPLGFAPLHPTTGALIPNGKLAFYRTGTTTAQDTYSDSTLLSANSNPIVLSAAGLLEAKCYGSPNSGYDYRVRLYTSADVLLTTWDDVKVVQSDVATIQEGSFTGTLTGYATPPTGTVTYRVISNIGGTGKICHLYLAAAIEGTSNATSLTMTGLPAAVTPAATSNTSIFAATDNNTIVSTLGSVSTGGVISFYTDEPLSSTGWTNPGTKGLRAATNLSYAL